MSISSIDKYTEANLNFIILLVILQSKISLNKNNDKSKRSGKRKSHSVND